MNAPLLTLGTAYCFNGFYNQSGDYMYSPRYIIVRKAEYKNGEWMYYENDETLSYKESDIVSFV